MFKETGEPFLYEVRSLAMPETLQRLRSAVAPPELWGGVECTVNRVHAIYRDQTIESGHHDRPDDIELIASIGFSAVRYPILWERISPRDPREADWRWSDDRLARLQGHNIRTIAGLVHHGSGPCYTNLLDPAFPELLAAHALHVARRYPWIDEWTPINEPLTTARFSALYGYWYPHSRDEAALWLALINQIDATRLAMRAVRETIADARLIQTEDLGRTYATARLGDQAAFDNQRRWMTFDLLAGHVVPGHPLWLRLCKFGLGDRLRAIADDPCPPDVLGINHYLTSDRLLDHRTPRYPRIERGGNGREAYVDIEAIRALDPPPQGLAGILREAWARYGSPLAVTEVHNGCTREDQMRWMAEAWRIAAEARAQGVDLKAVTSWALFGSTGWDTLLTAPGHYEAGAFDVRGSAPRATAMVPLLRSLAGGKGAAHPVLARQGWWSRDLRLNHPRSPRTAVVGEQRSGCLARSNATPAPVLIAGASGTLGRALASACRHRNIAYVLTSRAEIDLRDEESIAATLDRYKPWTVLNAAGWVRVDDAEDNEAACRAANAFGAARLAAGCAARGIATVSFSSDLVFDGMNSEPYDESGSPAPLNAYGRSKAAAEAALGALPGQHLVVRTAAFFSPFDQSNFAMHALGALAARRPFEAADDQIVTPTYVPDLCNAVLDLAIDGEQGLWHLTNEQACTWSEFAIRLAEASLLDPGLVIGRPGKALGQRATRPKYVPLTSLRGKLLPSLDRAIERFARDFQRQHHQHPEPVA